MRDRQTPQPLWLIGDPVSHSLSPVFQNAGLQAMGLPLVYKARPTRTEELPSIVDEIRRGESEGANVTLPFKGSAALFCDRLSESARRAGAVNTLVRVGGAVEGHNTDVSGLRRALAELDLGSPAPRRAVVLGAGGAARAAVVSLDQLGVESVAVVNRTAERGEVLARELGELSCAGLESRGLDAVFEDAGFWRGVELIVHTTSLGIGASPGSASSDRAEATWEALPWAEMDGLKAVFDVCYTKGETPFLAAAREVGRTVGEDGLAMLLYQGIESLMMWTGREPPEDLMREALWRAASRPL